MLFRSQPGITPDRCGVPLNKVLVGFIGRLVPIKRPDRFVDATKKLAPHHPDVAFVVVGDGPLGDETRARGASVPAIHFAGWRRDIAPVLAALDIVVLCSDNEGIPLSLIEASASGVPIVATKVGSVSDVVIDNVNGVLVEASDDALAAGIEKLLADGKLRDQMGEAGKMIVAENFSINAAQERHREMYRRLVNED